MLHPGLCSAPQGASPILVPTRGPRPPTRAGCCPHRCWHPARLRAQGQRRRCGLWQCPAGTAVRVPELVAGSQAGSAMQAGCGPSGPAMQAAGGQAAGSHLGSALLGAQAGVQAQLGLEGPQLGKGPTPVPCSSHCQPSPVGVVRAPTGPSRVPSIQAPVPSARRCCGPACRTPGSMEMSCLGLLLL